MIRADSITATLQASRMVAKAPARLALSVSIACFAQAAETRCRAHQSLTCPRSVLPINAPGARRPGLRERHCREKLERTIELGARPKNKQRGRAFLRKFRSIRDEYIYTPRRLDQPLSF